MKNLTKIQVKPLNKPTTEHPINQQPNVEPNTQDEKPKIPKRSNLLFLIYTAIKEILANSTSHGIPNIVRSNSIITKLVWLVFLLASTGLCSYLVAQSIFNYLNFDVNTKSRVFYEKEAQFPTITICNEQKLTTSFALEFLNEIANENNLTLYEAFANSYSKLQDKNYIDEFKKRLGFNMLENLFECDFNLFYNFCDDRDFLFTYKLDYGNCFVLNSGLNKSGIHVDLINSTYPGKLNGLQITMFLGVVKELKAFYSNYGLLIKIDNATSRDFKISNNYIEIAPGFETNIVVEREFTEQLPKPYSNCDLDNDNPNPVFKDPKLLNILSSLDIRYKQSICMELCYQTLLKDNCNCTDPVYNSFYDLNYCKTKEEEWNCINKIYNNFITDNGTRAFCEPFCPLECNQTRFYISLSSSKLNMDFYSKTIDEYAQYYGIISENETLSSEDKMNSIIKFNVYYGSLSYTITTESPAMDIVGLLSNIGGTLGLFLGVSVLTAVEIIEIFLQAILISIKN